MSYDLIVIGGGPGGYVAAIRAAQHGMKVALVEGGTLGGTCLNVGCIPSKALIETAHALRMAREAAGFGVRVTGVELDFVAMIKRQRQIVRRLTQGVAGLLRANGVTVISGWASVTAPGHVEVATEGGGARTLTARRILLATGSEPVVPPVPGLSGPGVGTSDTVWSLESLPPRVLVVGGGVIGIEMASLLGHLGSQVTVVELLPAVLPAADPEAVARLVEILSRSGVTIHTRTRLTEVAGRVAHCAGPDGTFTVEADYILVAAGRRPRLNRDELDRLGVAYGPGGIRVNESFATTVPGIYAIGDVAGGGLAHAAMAHALACVDAMAGEPAHWQPDAVPAVVYSMPELAWVGMTEQKVREAGIDCDTARFPTSALGRAHTLGETEGFIKLVTSRATGEVLGMHIIGPQASELINEGALAVTVGATAWDLAHTVHAHPTLSEGIQEAAHALLGGALHIPPKGPSPHRNKAGGDQNGR